MSATAYFAEPNDPGSCVEPLDDGDRRVLFRALPPGYRRWILRGRGPELRGRRAVRPREPSPDVASRAGAFSVGDHPAVASPTRVPAARRSRRPPAADGSLANASDRAARWYGVHSSPPPAPADPGSDGGEDGCRAGVQNGRVWTAGSARGHVAGSPLAFPTTRSRPPAWRAADRSERASVLGPPRLGAAREAARPRGRP